jgi:hypothetical protein
MKHCVMDEVDNNGVLVVYLVVAYKTETSANKD